MIADAIRFVLTNLPPILFVAALFIAYVRHTPSSRPRRYLDWLLLLSVGVEGIWAGVFHIFFPAVASGQIGWVPSPFEFEIGVADLSIGIVAVLSFWRSLSFKSAVVCYIALFYFGVAVGHLYQAASRHDFSPDNFGILLLLTIVKLVLLPWLLRKAWRAEPDVAAGNR
jgi:hypothetical protein